MSFYQKNKRPIILALVFIVSLYGLYLRADHRQRNQVCADEPSPKTLSKPFDEMFQQARSIMQFPGDLLLTYPFYKMFGYHVWGLSIPQVIATVIGFFVFYLICKQYFVTIGGYLIAFCMLALNSNLIDHAFIIRPYGVLSTLAVAAFLLTRMMVQQKQMTIRKKIGLGLFVFVCIGFHLYGILILFCCYVFHLICSRRDESLVGVFVRNFKEYWIPFAGALAVFAYFTIEPSRNYLGNNDTAYDTFLYIPKTPVGLLKGIFGNLIGFKKFYVFLPGIFLAMILPNTNKRNQILFFIFIIALPIGLILLQCIIAPYWFIQRLFIWVMPLFAFYLGWCWDSIIMFLLEKLKNK